MNDMIYLAGPIKGKSYNGAVDWRLEFSRAVERTGNVRCLDPMRGKTELMKEAEIDGAYPGSLMCGQPMIQLRDMTDLRRCDLVFVNLNGVPESAPSIGTIWEMGFAAALNKPMVVWSDDDAISSHPLLAVGAVFPHGDLKQCAKLCLDILGIEVGW